MQPFVVYQWFDLTTSKGLTIKSLYLSYQQVVVGETYS